MKKLLFTLLFSSVVCLHHCNAQAQELKQLALNIEKLAQFRQILKDMKKGYEILSKGYTTVKDLSEGNFNLHKTFLDALMQVSPAVRNYKRVGDIISYQLSISSEYNDAFGRFGASGAFNEQELTYLGRVYGNLLEQSLKNLDELTLILTANKLRMSDDERLQAIDRIYLDMQDKLSFLRDFNNRTGILALQRGREAKDAAVLRNLYRTNN